MSKKLQKDINELKEKDREREEKVKKIEEELERLKTRNRDELEGINNKLSTYEQDAIRNSKGPIPPDELLNFITEDIFGKPNKETLSLLGKYYNNIDGVRNQVFEILENHMRYMKKQKELDDKFIRTLKKLEEDIEKVVNFCIDQNSSEKGIEQSNENKQGTSIAQQKNGNRKRKSSTNGDSPSRQENGTKNISSRLRKHTESSPSKSNTESSSSTEYMSVDEPDEPMSVSSVSSVRSPMSTSESSESDSMLVDDSPEKVAKTKFAKNATEKNSKQSEEVAANYSGTVETVPEIAVTSPRRVKSVNRRLFQ